MKQDPRHIPVAVSFGRPDGSFTVREISVGHLLFAFEEVEQAYYL
jgi:hypothetical protein